MALAASAARCAAPGEDGVETSVWDAMGQQPESVFLRFGSLGDQATFGVMRYLAFIDAVWIPFLVSFSQLSWLRPLVLQPAVVAVDVAMSVIYTTGVLLQLRTSVVKLVVAQEYLDPTMILTKRLSEGTFWCDCVSLLGGFWWHPAFPWSIAGFRMFRAWRCLENADDLYELHLAVLTSDNWVSNFVRMAAELALVIHSFSCTWFLAATFSSETWEGQLGQDMRFSGGGFFALYIAYFADGARMLAGWGAPDPLDPGGLYSRPERIAWCILAPTAAIYSAIVFAKILDVVEQASASTAKHLQTLGKLSEGLDALFVPANLKRRCLRYHSFLTIHNANKAEYDTLLESMSLNLQHDLKLHLFDELLRQVPFLQGIPDYVRNALALIFEQAVFGPGQIIYSKGEPGEDVFIMMKGVAEVVLDDVVVSQLQAGQHFGETTLLAERTRSATVQAQTFCMCAMMHCIMFKEVLKSDLVMKEYILHKIANPTAAEGASRPPGEATPLLSERDALQPRTALEGWRQPQALEEVVVALDPEKLIRQAAAAREVLASHTEQNGGSLGKVVEDVDRICENLEMLEAKFGATETRLGNLEMTLVRETAHRLALARAARAG